MSDRVPGFSTLAIHAGAQPDPTTGARATPIYQTTSFVFDDVDHAASLFGLQAFGNIYTRIGNPTNAVLEERVAALEGGTAALAVASGHAAQFLVIPRADAAGRRVHRLAGSSMAARSTSSTIPTRTSTGTCVWADPDDLVDLRGGDHAEDQGDLHRDRSPIPAASSPTSRPSPQIAQAAGVPLIVDNTLASPYLCRPIEHGADIVVHSPTKFLGGHGNSIGGIIVDGGTFDWSPRAAIPMLSAPRPEYGGIVLARDLRQFRLRHRLPRARPARSRPGAVAVQRLPDPHRHRDAAAAHAAAIPTMRWRSPNFWRSTRRSPGSTIRACRATASTRLARKYCPKGAGAVFTFGLKGGYEAGVKLVSKVKLFSHLANVGDTRSLIIHPASTTHRQLSDEQKTAAGAGPEVVRISIGIEDADRHHRRSRRGAGGGVKERHSVELEAGQPIRSSCPGLSRASTTWVPLGRSLKTWMPATRAGMTSGEMRT
ncbi:MAG: PLP-dependent transferase [Piscinibacter sp.]